MDVEKVISKLEKEVQRTYSIKTTIFQNGEKVSEEINTHREPGVRIPIEMADKILALLKEQEPRILDWDEIRNYPVVYGEFRGVEDIYPLIITVDSWGRCLSWNPGINVSKEFILLVSDEEDRKNTRCWDKMPTEEQRQAVTWDD